MIWRCILCNSRNVSICRNLAILFPTQELLLCDLAWLRCDLVNPAVLQGNVIWAATWEWQLVAVTHLQLVCQPPQKNRARVHKHSKTLNSKVLACEGFRKMLRAALGSEEDFLTPLPVMTHYLKYVIGWSTKEKKTALLVSVGID